MRSLASDDAGPGTANDAGGPAAGAVAPDAAATSAAAAAATSALAERLTRLGVEEVHARDVDCDRDDLLDLKLDVGRVLGDEVRPRRDHALVARRLLFLFFVLLAFAHHVGVDVEVHDRLAAERLDELDLGLERRQVGTLGRGVEVLAAHAGDHRPSAVAAQRGIRGERLIGHGKSV